MDNKEKIVSLIRQKGPCLPSNIYKELETNQLFASAMLGELVSSGTLKVSNLKRSSSPYYYLEDEKEKLQSIASYLNDKDTLAYNLIKEKLIIRDSEQSALIRVTLRAIKDFAIPIHIKLNGEPILFWKWFILSNKEAEEKIKEILGIKKPELPKKEIKKEEIKPEPKEIETKQEPEKQIEQPIPKEKIETKVIEKQKIEDKKIKQKEITQKIKEPLKEIETKFPKELEEKQEHLIESKIDTSSPFLNKLTKYFEKNNIKIIEQEITNRTKTEVDFILEIPSPVGNLQYYCKAKNKKKINDSDIASAYVQGQQKKLPILVVITGDMTKKSKEMLNNEFRGIKVQKI
jgi:hypothetical protein